VNAICQDILGVLGAVGKVLYTKQEVTSEIHLYVENFIIKCYIILENVIIFFIMELLIHCK